MSPEILELHPDAAQAQRLAEVHRQAFDAHACWSAADFSARTDPQFGLTLADAALTDAVLVLQFAADECEVLTLAVVPASRGKRLATRLVRRGIEIARDRRVQRLFLEVAVDNAPAIGLYQKLGFTQVGTRKQYYRRDDRTRIDAVVMSLSI